MKNTNVENLIYTMLKENTGIAMMDSGGEDGRMWQRNAKKTLRNFQTEPSVTVEAEDNSAIFTVSTFKYLTSGVIELDELCEEFNALPCKDWEGEAYGVSKAQEAWLKDHGIEYGDSWNTYNGETSLDQVLQGTNLKTDGCGEGEYILLQIHGGADVRGGYTDAKMFKYARFQEGIDPCPYIGGEIDGVPYSLYGNTDFVNEEGQSFDPNITPTSKITAYLENE